MDALTVSTAFHPKILECFENIKKKPSKLPEIVCERKCSATFQDVARNCLVVIRLHSHIHAWSQ